MPSTHSIAEARKLLPSLIQRAQAGEAVRISRRGQSVAVVISEQEYARLTAGQPQIGSILHAWQQQLRQHLQSAGQGDPQSSEAKIFTDLRDRSDRPAPDFA